MGQDLLFPCEFMSVKGESRLGAKGVPGSEPARQYPKGPSRIQDGLPKLRGILWMDVKLVADWLASVTGSGAEHLFSLEGKFKEFSAPEGVQTALIPKGEKTRQHLA